MTELIEADSRKANAALALIEQEHTELLSKLRNAVNTGPVALRGGTVDISTVDASGIERVLSDLGESKWGGGSGESKAQSDGKYRTPEVVDGLAMMRALVRLRKQIAADDWQGVQVRAMLLEYIITFTFSANVTHI